MNIAICEPECTGFQHEEVNAGILKIISESNCSKLFLFSEKEHSQIIKNIYQKRLNKKIEINHFDVDLPFGKNFELIRYYLFTKYIYSELIKLDIQKIYFTSINSKLLIAINILLPKYSTINTSIFLHGILDQLNYTLSSKLKKNIFWFGRIFKKSNNNIKYYVLSNHIREKLLDFEIGEKKISVLNHPYIWNNLLKVKKYPRHVTKICCIGSMHKDKGKYNLRKIITELIDMQNDFEISIFGYYRYKIKDPRIKIYDRRFTRSEFDNYIPQYDFVLLPYEKKSYQLKVSGAFFDALNYEIPIITINNPFTKHFFNVLGDIGIILDSNEELIQYLKKIIISINKKKQGNMKAQIKLAKIILSQSMSINN